MLTVMGCSWEPPNNEDENNYGYKGVCDMQVNVAPLQIINFHRNFTDEISHWQVETFLEEVEQVNLGSALLEYGVFGVVETAFTLLLSAENTS